MRFRTGSSPFRSLPSLGEIALVNSLGRRRQLRPAGGRIITDQAGITVRCPRHPRVLFLANPQPEPALRSSTRRSIPRRKPLGFAEKSFHVLRGTQNGAGNPELGRFCRRLKTKQQACNAQSSEKMELFRYWPGQSSDSHPSTQLVDFLKLSAFRFRNSRDFPQICPEISASFTFSEA